MSIKLIIFDFDGTLGDTRRNIVTTMQMTIKEMQLPERSEAECASTIGEQKTACKDCPTHCYAPKEREAIREVMRWAGPRMIWYAPKDAILHILKK